MGNGTQLCARQADPSQPAALSVAPCFLPNLLAGPYWVLAVGYNPDSSTMEWAIVSGGQPTIEYADGCTTSTTTTNGSGLWIFSHQQLLSPDGLAAARSTLVDLGFTLTQLIDVPQEGCAYEKAIIKE